MKKMIVALLLMMSICSSTFAATTLQAPGAVGNYNYFGQQIRLDIYVKNTNASQYKIYFAKGYMVSKGFKSYVVKAMPNYTDRQNQKAVRTEFQVPSQGWWTIEVVSVGKDGRTSKPFITDVYVLR